MTSSLDIMNQRLAKLIGEYLTAVSVAVKLLELAGIERPKSNSEWAGNGVPQIGVLPSEIKYYKHGYGCAVHLETGVVDFDFGENGEINGFDTWRLLGFANNKLSDYGFTSENEFDACFKAEVTAGTLVYSGYILHYLGGADI